MSSEEQTDFFLSKSDDFSFSDRQFNFVSSESTTKDFPLDNFGRIRLALCRKECVLICQIPNSMQLEEEEILRTNIVLIILKFIYFLNLSPEIE